MREFVFPRDTSWLRGHRGFLRLLSGGSQGFLFDKRCAAVNLAGNSKIEVAFLRLG
jgi:hypothetical protein